VTSGVEKRYLRGKEIIIHLFFNDLCNFIKSWVEWGFNPRSKSHFCSEHLRVDIVLGEIDLMATTEVAATIVENKEK